MADPNIYEIYTDGACSGNPGPGGWGVFITHKGVEKDLSGGERQTTNNRMEMQAAIEAMKAVPEGVSIILHTDSQYLKNGLTQWIHGWKRNGWKTAARKPVKNQELWQELDTLCAARNVTWKWVKGHAGDPGNERADLLANKGMASVR